MKNILFAIALCAPSFASGFEVDPAYQRLADETGGKIYKVTPEELNNPAIRDQIVKDMLRDYKQPEQPGFGAVEFYRFHIVQETGGAHGGLFPVRTAQQAGAKVIGEATLFGDVSKVNFFLLDEKNQKITDVTLSKDYPEGNDYIGYFTVPTVPFRVGANGMSADGKPFERYSNDFVVPALRQKLK